MKSILMVFVALGWGLVSPSMATAQVYKWTDKDGTVRYTDLPPPTSIKNYQVIGGKKPKDSSELATPSEKSEASPASTNAAPPAQGSVAAPPNAVQDMQRDLKDAQERQKAEIEKQNKEAKLKEAKQKQENCEAAKINYQNYSQGGRIFEINENGERVYVSDEGLEQKAAEAQRQIQQYCN